jgi:UDP-GlcNAc:undecaprenyl-phosphate GlcNAc-1-phosphate transferase
MLLGLMLAYGPISSTASLDPALLTNYSGGNHTLDRFPTFLPLLVPAAIFVIPYADLMFAVIRRTRAGKPLMAADRQHLHHRVLNIGHSYRQSVLIMYLWAALFSVTVVSLSVVRTRLVVFVVATAVAVLALLPVTMPRLRPWRLFRGPQAIPAVARRGTAAAAAHRGPAPAAAHRGTVPAAYRGTAPAARHGTRRATPRPAGPVLNGVSSSGAAPIQFPGDQLPRAGRLPGVDPVAPFAPAYPVDPLGPAPASNGPASNGPASNGRQPHPDPFAAPDPFPDPFPGHAPDPFAAPGHAPDPFAAPDPFPRHGPAPGPAAGPAESPDPLAPPQHRDAQPW